MGRVDIAFRDVRILDGSGGPASEGDLGIDGGRIASVGGTAGPADVEIAGGGQVLAPGFVDTHTHDDGALLAYPGLEFKLAQGCTTLVIGNCGFSLIPGRPGEAHADNVFGRVGVSWDDLDGFREVVTARKPACNAVALIGHNAMRTSAMGVERRAPSGPELRQMRDWTARAMEQGACGLSTGLIYVPGRYAETDEVVELAGQLAPRGGLYATHMRNEGDRLLEAVEEAVRIGSDAGVGVHISHHKAAGQDNWGKVAESLDRVDRANEAGGDVTLDVYPYTAGSGPMIQYFDLDRIDAELAANIRVSYCPAFPELEGRMLTDVAAERGTELTELVHTILTSPQGDETISIQYGMSETDIETNLRHPKVMIGSDGIPNLAGKPHPRLFGTFPRVLGEYVRHRGVITLEEAVRRMTSLSCERFGLDGRGRIREGWWADLVLFDPGAVVDVATYEDPMREPVGVSVVVVNGAIAYRDGHHTGVGAGRLLRYRDAG
ncbi:MAG TPA: D-aminoacylase [Acidimicrobiales bacterium]|nr:D-aminoacylase [Acidimicrobiales bacterium]